MTASFAARTSAPARRSPALASRRAAPMPATTSSRARLTTADHLQALGHRPRSAPPTRPTTAPTRPGHQLLPRGPARRTTASSLPDDVDCSACNGHFADAERRRWQERHRRRHAQRAQTRMNYAADLRQRPSTTATISKRSVTASITAADKTYDGSATPRSRAARSRPAADHGVVSPDDVDCSASNGHFADADAGVGKNVTADVELTGTDKTNYEPHLGERLDDGDDLQALGHRLDHRRRQDLRRHRRRPGHELLARGRSSQTTASSHPTTSTARPATATSPTPMPAWART